VAERNSSVLFGDERDSVHYDAHISIEIKERSGLLNTFFMSNENLEQLILIFLSLVSKCTCLPEIF
jgi:hypothetical protein